VDPQPALPSCSTHYWVTSKDHAGTCGAGPTEPVRRSAAPKTSFTFNPGDPGLAAGLAENGVLPESAICAPGAGTNRFRFYSLAISLAACSGLADLPPQRPCPLGQSQTALIDGPEPMAGIFIPPWIAAGLGEQDRLRPRTGRELPHTGATGQSGSGSTQARSFCMNSSNPKADVC